MAENETGEIHIHLRGATPVEFFEGQYSKIAQDELIGSISKKHLDLFKQSPNLVPFLEETKAENIQGLFAYQDFNQFLATYLFTAYLVRSNSDFYLMAKKTVDTLVAQSYTFVELTVSVPEYLLQKIELEEVLDSLQKVKKEASIPIAWILDPVRNFGAEHAETLLRNIMEIDRDCFTGVTIGGSEHLFPPAPFEGFYKLARESGLKLSVHAGENLGARSIWDAIKVLKVDRIGHGIRALEDLELVEYLAKNQIPLEVCITSNLKTGVVSTLKQHPVRELFVRDVPITINTDDPTFFATSLQLEFEILETLGFSQDEIDAIRTNSQKYSFIEGL